MVRVSAKRTSIPSTGGTTALRLAKWSTTAGCPCPASAGSGPLPGSCPPPPLPPLPARPRLIIERKFSKLDNKDFVCGADGRLRTYATIVKVQKMIVKR